MNGFPKTIFKAGAFLECKWSSDGACEKMNRFPITTCKAGALLECR
jgi:hypothetical protein